MSVDGNTASELIAFAGSSGPPGRVHPGVAQGLRRVVDLSQARAPYHAEVADVRPRLPLVGAQMALDELYLCVQERHPELSAFSF